jgi:hypothetical protein
MRPYYENGESPFAMAHIRREWARRYEAFMRDWRERDSAKDGFWREVSPGVEQFVVPKRPHEVPNWVIAVTIDWWNFPRTPLGRADLRS